MKWKLPKKISWHQNNFNFEGRNHTSHTNLRKKSKYGRAVWPYRQYKQHLTPRAWELIKNFPKIWWFQDNFRNRLQWEIDEQSPCLTGFHLKILSNGNEATGIILRENVRQFKLAPSSNHRGWKFHNILYIIDNYKFCI